MEMFIQEALVSDKASLYVVLVIFVTGVLTSLTPCVYPMLPITVAVVRQHANNVYQSTAYTCLYVLGLALSYSLLGYFAAKLGYLFGSVATHPAMLFIAGSFCLVMAVWMLGWINMPQLSFAKNSFSSYAPLNVFVSGGLSGLVMAPCTSPVLGMLLMYVSTEQAPFIGPIYLFAFALGLSALLFIAGIFSNVLNKLPKSGPWLNAFKYILAALLVGVALYFYFQITF